VETVGAQEDQPEEQRPAVVYQNPRKRRTRDNFARGVPAGQKFERKRRKDPECNNGIKDRGARRQLHLRKKRTTSNGIRGRSRRQELRLGSVKILYETLGQILDLEDVKRAVGISIGLRKVSDWTMWGSRYPLKRKKRRPKHGPQEKMMMVHLERLAPYQ
jgi:hypothetical protein